MNASSEYLHCYWHILLPLFAADSVRRSSRSSGNGPTSSQPWHLSNHTVGRKKNVSFHCHPTHAQRQFAPKAKRFVYEKESNMSREDAYRRIAWSRCCSRRSCPPPSTPRAPARACSRRSAKQHEFDEITRSIPPQERKRIREPNTEFRTHRNSEIHGADYTPGNLRWLVQLLGETEGGGERERNRNPR